MTLIIHTDGGARGNPGPAAIGVVIEENGKEIFAFGKAIGEATNNVAEYTAVVEALKKAKNTDVNFFLDSTLVVNQLKGVFKIKDAKLRELFLQVKMLEGERDGTVTYTYIPREQNTRADFFVNQALDDAAHV